MTKILVNLTCFFGCAFLGAAMVLFTGWPLALVAAALCFLATQHVLAGFARRADKRATAREFAQIRKMTIEFQGQIEETRARIGALDGLIDERTNAQGRKIVSELKVLESLMREFAGKISRGASEAQVPRIPSTGPAAAYLGSFGDKNELLETIRASLEENRVDLYLQPMVTLPQRKVRFYEAVTRLRDERDQIIAADDFVGIAEAAGLIGRIDHMVMLRCVQVLRRLMVRNKEVGIFCNVSAETLGHPGTFAQCMDFLEANRALAPSFVLEFKQSTLCNLGPTETEHLAALAQRGFRFSIDHVTDLRFEPRDLADRGVRFIKVPAALLLDPRQASSSDIHPSDLSDLLGRFGIDLIAERIEGERSVVDLLDYDVRFGQGFLFAPPRPLRPEGASATGEAAPNQTQDSNGSSKTAPVDVPPINSPKATGTAALVRRIAGPG